ncbi:hypothetical protein SSX86_008241 [Deinandra increscens subsp. villosa]|uniref:Myb-like domain-containing protein n=1 Tax=Deinandra increscens subsp. villosa TaxID=3103831 RepID=A0AAP0DFI8_9ASTR
MADKCSIVPSVVWNWVIEALASSEQADLSILNGLVQKAPAISGDAGKDTREIVSLRCLEVLSAHGNEATVDAKTPKVSFDCSERCEDVLKKILHETPEQMANLEKARWDWDVGPFLKHKRSFFSRCLLKKLKEGILANNNPLLAPLKEKSKLVISKAAEDTSPASDDSGSQDMHKMRHNKRVSAENILEFVVKSKNSNNKLQPSNERVNCIPLLAALKEKSTLVIPNAFEDTSLANDDSVGHNKRVSAENMENLEFVVKSKDCNNNVQPSNGRANDDNSNPLLAALKEKSTLVIADASEDTNLADDDNAPQDTHTEEHNKKTSSENMETLEFVLKFKDYNNGAQQNNQRANVDPETTGIASIKEAFLKSQCTTSQDLCMKCNESRDLLVCSSDSCLLKFHDSCLLGSAATLEENGKSFCPFCAYSRADSKYQEAMRNVSLARKNLQAFFNFTVRPRSSKSSTKGSEELEVNEDRQMGANNIDCIISNEKDSDPVISDVNEDREVRANNTNCIFNEKDSTLPDPMITYVNDVGDGDGPSVKQTTELPQNPTRESSTSKQKCPTRESNTQKQKCPTRESSTPKQKCKEKESSNLATSLLRKRKVKDIPPPFPQLRRTKLRWTKSEEETLKEGVERYSNGNDKKISWKEILDFGHNVFDKGRTTIDLKDKWRNMCK